MIRRFLEDLNSTYWVTGLIIVVSLEVGAAAETDAGTGNSVTGASIPQRSQTLDTQLREALEGMPSGYIPRTEHLLEDGSPRYTNRLILEDSPYLLQHAHNPVDWHAWGEPAFARARRENKPVFLSIGYSTCHWCHVMERESFENAAIADFINRHFIAIKVDRERRPDVDETYMTAVNLLTGGGGWPMTSFLTPAGKPFHGGTYFRPKEFLDLLHRVARQWKEQPSALLKHGERVAAAVKKVGRAQQAAAGLNELALRNAISSMIAKHDDELGGFGSAPKFPREPMLLLLLTEALRSETPEILHVLDITLDAMARGGIYDQVGGGFHRYATDDEWFVPHWEKMLYNQAHLARVYLQGWYLTGNILYRRVATQTMDYVLRDMTSKEGAFYSATDADSEGDEGMFFFWRPLQVRTVLSAENAELALELFDISENGYHEDLNILHLPRSLAAFAQSKGLSLSTLLQRVDHMREKLYQAREKREHPLRDEKILTAWNGMMISTLAEAGMKLNEARYIDAAIRAANFIWTHNRRSKGALWRVHFAGRPSIAGQQEDYAYFAEALLQLYDAIGDKRWLQRARLVTDEMLKRFWDSEHGGFFMSGADQPLTGMGRARDGGTDNAIPSGNSVALRVLQMLDVRTGNPEYGNKAAATLAAFAGAINNNPEAYSYMLVSAGDMQSGEMGTQRYAARGGIRVKARQSATDRVAVDITIPPGWHINSNRPLQQELIATSLSLQDEAGSWRALRVDYPASVLQALGFQSEPLSLYQGDISIGMKLTGSAETKRIVPLRLDLQACNDRVCLPPEKLDLRVAMQ